MDRQVVCGTGSHIIVLMKAKGVEAMTESVITFPLSGVQ